MLLTVEIEGEDQKTKDKGAMGADTELWLTKDVSGFDEQNKFYCKVRPENGFARVGQSMGDSLRAWDRIRESAESAQAMRKKMEGPGRSLPY